MYNAHFPISDGITRGTPLVSVTRSHRMIQGCCFDDETPRLLITMSYLYDDTSTQIPATQKILQRL